MTEENENLKGDLFSNMFAFQASIYQNTMEDLTDQLANQRPSDANNHTNWLLGHILHSRYMAANLIDIEAQNPFGKTCGNAIENKHYPSINEVSKHFDSISLLLVDKLSKMTNAELDAKPAVDKPSKADIISFLIYHEAYHLGQIGYVRKMTGMESLKSN